MLPRIQISVLFLTFALLSGCGDDSSDPAPIPVPIDSPVAVATEGVPEVYPDQAVGRFSSASGTDLFIYDVELASRSCGDVPLAIGANEARLSGALPASLLEGSYDIGSEASLTVTTMEPGLSGDPIQTFRRIISGEVIIANVTVNEVTIQVDAEGSGASAYGQFTVPICP